MPVALFVGAAVAAITAGVALLALERRLPVAIRLGAAPDLTQDVWRCASRP